MIRLYIEKTAKLLMIVLFVNYLIGCGSNNIINKTIIKWNDATTNVLLEAKNPDGGFGPIGEKSRETIDLYYTNYAIKLLKELNKTMKNKDETIKRLYLMEADTVLKTRCLDTSQELFWIVDSLRNLNAPLSKEEEVRNYVSKRINDLRSEKYSDEIIEETYLLLQINLVTRQNVEKELIINDLKNNLRKIKENNVWEPIKFMVYESLKILGEKLTEIEQFNIDINQLAKEINKLDEVKGDENFDLGKALKLLYGIKILKLNNPDFLIPQNVKTFFIKSRVTKGGFNFFSNQKELDPQDTYYVLELAEDFNKKDLDQILKSVTEHELKQGGFSPLLSTNSTIKNTYYVFFIDKYLQKQIVNEETNSYINSKIKKISTMSWEEKYLLKQMAINVFDNYKNETRFLPTDEQILMSNNIKETLYMLKLYKESQNQISDKLKSLISQRIYQLNVDKKGYGFNNRVDSQITFYSVSILHELGLENNLIGCTNWMKGQKTTDGGYNFEGGKNGSLKDTWLAINILQLLGENMTITEKKSVEKFLKRHLLPSGAVGIRPNGDEPHLAATYWYFDIIQKIRVGI